MSGLDHLDYDELALLAEVHQFVSKATALAGGSAPAAGSPQWWSAEPQARLAGLLVLAERYLLEDPHRLAAEQLKAVSLAISGALDWSAFANRPSFGSHAEIVARRAELGPLAGLVFDPVREARWVATGSSEDEEVAA